MRANDRIFREYDIRGVVGADFDEEFAWTLGRVFGDTIIAGVFVPAPAKTPTVAVGHDCRLSADAVTGALIEGLRSAGVDVLFCGMGPTPQLYFVTYSRSLDGGIQVTASHNPSDQNGFKMLAGLKTLSGTEIQELKRRVKMPTVRSPSRRGTLTSLNAREAYTADLIQRSAPHIGSRALTVAVDGGNGVGGLVGPAVLRGLGCQVIELYTDPDGRFPNHHPDPTVLENLADLRAAVAKHRADLGIAWDGDADRIGVVDEQGTPIYGDMLVVLYGRRLLQEVNTPVIIGDVKCSELMFSDLAARGAQVVMARTGHSLIKAKLKEVQGHLAGEMSGHMFFSHRYFGFDDALHASARLVEILSNTTAPLSSLLGDIPRTFCTPEIRVECPEEIKFTVAERAQHAFPEFETTTIDGARVKFPRGWGLVRASNTQPVLVLRFEAETPELLAEYQQLVENRLERLRREISAA